MASWVGSAAGTMAALEPEELHERGAAVEGLVLGDRARRRARGRVAELRGLGEGGQRRGHVRPQRPEQAEGRADDHVAEVRQRADVQDLDLEDVARLRALHLDRAGQRVYAAQVEGQGPLRGERPGGLADVEGIAAQQLDHLAGTDRDGRRDVAVPAVVQDLVVAVEHPGLAGPGHRVGAAGSGEIRAHRPVAGRDAGERGRGRLADGRPLHQAARVTGMDEAHRSLPRA